MTGRPTHDAVWSQVFDDRDRLQPQYQKIATVERCIRAGHVQAVVVPFPFGAWITWHPRQMVSRVGDSRSPKGNWSQWIDEWVDQLPGYVDAICRCGQPRRVDLSRFNAVP